MSTEAARGYGPMASAAESGRRASPATIEIVRESAGREEPFLAGEVDLGADSAPEGTAFRRTGDDRDADPGLLETDRLTVRIFALEPASLEGIDLQLRAGNVPVAGTAPELSEERKLLPAARGWECSGAQIFLDCAGHADLTVLTRWPDEESYRRVATFPVQVAPGKITSEELEHLISMLEEAAQGVLFEAYAKTSIGVRQGGPERGAAPAEKLERIASTLSLFGAQLARMAHRPAQRLTLRPRRVLISPGEPITPETSMEIAEDTSLLARTSTGVLPRERIEMAAERDIRLLEHEALSGFLAHLAGETREILDLIRAEIESRLQRRRLFASTEGGIWVEREEPRIQALRALEAKARILYSRCRDLRRRHDFLPLDSPPLRRPPELTKRFAHAGSYPVLYRSMRDYHRSHGVELRGEGLLVGSKSLPVLWEYWSALRVIDFLQRRLRYALSPWESVSGLFRRVAGFHDRYILDLQGDRRLEFADDAGRRVLFRYQPLYHSMTRRGAFHGRLKRRAAPFEPDIAIEVYAAGADPEAVPEHIAVLDAKYTSRSHDEVLDSMLRYRNIGDFRTGRRLARQVWALSSVLKGPPPAGRRSHAPPGLEAHATVDNDAFFEEGFSALGEVCGVLGVRPDRRRIDDPIDLLLDRILDVFGVETKR